MKLNEFYYIDCVYLIFERIILSMIVGVKIL